MVSTMLKCATAPTTLSKALGLWRESAVERRSLNGERGAACYVHLIRPWVTQSPTQLEYSVDNSGQSCAHVQTRQDDAGLPHCVVGSYRLGFARSNLSSVNRHDRVSSQDSHGCVPWSSDQMTHTPTSPTWTPNVTMASLSEGLSKNLTRSAAAVARRRGTAVLLLHVIRPN
ncbi:uncharacterized protein BDZ99DRAFT_247592 [Mytilinidion resinicola]|uniref:Uncharacterized protein n=1 Tax=Mytilinidion resinicola TaxID=574789 RepID=A0A6A6YWT0_9PEZI|nr:uncharacterized protein BDZ99DRAFT_247592 [Mytilinidion resinicola]KAF2813018.1 hypothetical protein BDZ99DRAFT_247592 [Mytilinidion resinicola]